MNAENKVNFYIKKKKLLMRTFDAMLLIAKQTLIDNFGEEKCNEMVTSTRNEFEKLIPHLPYIGGNDNRLTEPLINAAGLLPILRSVEKQGLEFREIGRITYELFEAFYRMIPQSEDIFSEEYLNKERKRARESKLKNYPGDWVSNFIEGDGKTFTFGVDYSECGVYKFYKSQDAEHFMPLVCIADFAQARAYGYGLTRTQTIGNGADICDFRYLKGGSIPRAWPPDHLPEFKK
ncbi:MAG: L-2-amino-thiazoline-4-carboxylic acid hydrolase [Promethearchaeota archaeon]